MAGHSIRLIGGTSDVRADFYWEKDRNFLGDTTDPELRLLHAGAANSGVYRLVARNSEELAGAPVVGESTTREAAIAVLMPPQTPGVIDLSWQDAGIGGAEVRTVATTGDGGCMIAGDFTLAGSIAGARIARLHSDGTLDPTFAAGTGADARIRALAAHGGGWVAGGDFLTFNGQPHAHLVRLFDDGAVDTAFKPPAISSNVRALAVQRVASEDRVIVGLSAAPWLIRLRPDGQTDGSFNANVAAAGINGRVNAIALPPDGRILLGGSFFMENAWPFHRIGRLLADGQPDTAGFVNGSSTGADAEVLSVAPAPSGRIVLGGKFTSVHGQTRFYIARLLENGQLDAAFNPSPNDFVNGVAVLPDGRVLAAGDFSRIDSGSIRSLARLTVSGQRDPDWMPPGFDDRAWTVTLAANDRVIVGGEFSQPHSLVVRLLDSVPQSPPTLVTKPSDVTIDAGAGASLNIAVLAPPDATFTWRRNDAVIGVTQTGEWPIARASADDAGSYTVEVASASGQTVAGPFNVRVRPISAGARPLMRGLASGLPMSLPNQGIVTIATALPAINADEVRVTLAIDHYDTNDLIIDLIVPGGQTVRLFDPDVPTTIRRGRNFDFTVFANSAPVRINDAAAPYTGTFRPSGDSPGLDALARAHVAGNWTLKIEDTRDDDNTGTLRAFAVDVFGRLPLLDAAVWNTWPLPVDAEPLVSLTPERLLTIRHWSAPPGQTTNYELSTDLNSWLTLEPSAWIRARRSADQWIDSTLRLPPATSVGSCFLRLRAH
jgi:uncharacterized delta-60 repeat protein